MIRKRGFFHIGCLFLVVILIVCVYFQMGQWWRFTRIKAKGAAYPLVFIEETRGSADSDEAMPMVVGLHGYGSQPHYFLSSFDACEATARYIIPRAYFGTFGRKISWFDLDDREASIRVVGDSVAVSLAELMKKYPTKGKPVLFGFSQGATLAYYIAVNHPEVTSAVYIVAGKLDQSLFPAEREQGVSYPPLYIYHGTNDYIIQMGYARSGVARLKTLKIPVTFRTYAGDHFPPEDIRKEILDTLSTVLS